VAEKRCAGQSGGSSPGKDLVKPIRFSSHALTYLDRRGFSLEEVEEAMRTAPWKLAEFGRLECHKDFAFGRAWNGVVYTTKRVRPIFVEESDELVVVTVYTYYF
jgi:hypothetical protein